MYFSFKKWFWAGLVMLSVSVQAQNMGNSPFSRLGVGDVANPAFGPHQAMGSAGVAYSNGLFINNLNPSLWARNRSVVLEVGVAGQYKKMFSTSQTQRLIGGNLNYLAFAFPVARYWTTGLVLAPYSSVNYEVRDSVAVRGTTSSKAIATLAGKGGLSSVSFTNGFNLYKNKWYVGLQTSYIFGATTGDIISRIDSLPYNVASQERVNASGFTFKPGVTYRKKWNYSKSDSVKAIYISVAGTYDFAASIPVLKTQTLENRASEPNGLPILQDTILHEQSGRLKLPEGYRLGINLEKPFHWAVSLDFLQKKWANYESFGTSAKYKNTYAIALGGEWTPDINSVSSYLKRITFRGGLNYSQLPNEINGKQMTDRSVSLGFFLPITPQDRSGVSYINTTLVLGRRGEKTVLQENYFKVIFGFTINNFDWFHRYRVD